MVRNKKAEVIKKITNKAVEVEIGSILKIMDWIKEYTEKIDLIKIGLKTTLLAMNIDTHILEIRVETEAETTCMAGVKTAFVYQGKTLFGHYVGISPYGDFSETPEQSAEKVRGYLFELIAEKVAAEAMVTEEDRLRKAFGLKVKR